MWQVIQEHKSGAKVARSGFASDVLAHNLAEESPVRPVTAFLPAESQEEGARFPVLYCLAAWTSAGRSQFDWAPFKESLFDRLVRLISEKKIPPCIVVAPDLYTRFGGSQYINSSYLGAHADYLVRELIPWVEANLPVKKGPGFRGAFGRSSGGFGALRLAMDYPGEFCSIACHSGDMGFDLVYQSDLIALASALLPYKGNVKGYLDFTLKQPKVSGRDIHILMLLGMAATYSPNSDRPEGFDLPIDLHTGVIDQQVWQKWVSHDPVVRISGGNEWSKELGCLYIECGNRDQYNLHYGARRLHNELAAQGVNHHYFEFDDNHSGTSYRYDVSLPIMLEAMQ